MAFAAVSVAETAAAIGMALAPPKESLPNLSEQWLFFCNGIYEWSCASGSW